MSINGAPDHRKKLVIKPRPGQALDLPLTELRLSMEGQFRTNNSCDSAVYAEGKEISLQNIVGGEGWQPLPFQLAVLISLSVAQIIWGTFEIVQSGATTISIEYFDGGYILLQGSEEYIQSVIEIFGQEYKMVEDTTGYFDDA